MLKLAILTCHILAVCFAGFPHHAPVPLGFNYAVPNYGFVAKYAANVHHPAAIASYIPHAPAPLTHSYSVYAAAIPAAPHSKTITNTNTKTALRYDPAIFAPIPSFPGVPAPLSPTTDIFGYAKAPAAEMNTTMADDKNADGMKMMKDTEDGDAAMMKAMDDDMAKDASESDMKTE